MIRLCIDPGHGGSDPGAVGNGLQEKNLTLDISLRVRSALGAYQVTVYLTRDSDIDLGLSERANYANNLEVDYFCSIHTNAGGGTGFESYIYTAASGKSKTIQGTLHTRLSTFYQAAGFADRGKKSANFAVLRETNMPASLLENLFIDRPSDAAKLADPGFRQGIAEAIAAGLVDALGLQPKVPDPIADAVKVLQAAGVIASPEYWLENARPGRQASGEYVGYLLQKMAAKLRTVG